MLQLYWLLLLWVFSNDKFLVIMSLGMTRDLRALLGVDVGDLHLQSLQYRGTVLAKSLAMCELIQLSTIKYF